MPIPGQVTGRREDSPDDWVVCWQGGRRDCLHCDSVTAFYTGLHIYTKAHHFERCMVSVNVLGFLKSLRGFSPNEWILDSGAFSRVTSYGDHTLTPAEYAREIRWASGKGTLVAAVTQDYMCEDVALKATGGTVDDHQRKTIERYDALLREDTGSVYVMPVLQGRSPTDYVNHLRQYGRRFPHGAYVGVGSVCKRQGDPEELLKILSAIKSERPDLKLHGFGVKITALAVRAIRELLYSTDSMAWSASARHRGDDANDYREALAYTERVRSLDDSPRGVCTRCRAVRLLELR